VNTIGAVEFSLIGDNGHAMAFGDSKRTEGGDAIALSVGVNADWFQAVVRVQLSVTSLRKFVQALHALSPGGTAELIADEGYLVFNIVLHTRGNATAKGVLSPSWHTDAQLHFSFETNLGNVDAFAAGMRRVANIW
jgi:hypothetical protein